MTSTATRDRRENAGAASPLLLTLTVVTGVVDAVSI